MTTQHRRPGWLGRLFGARARPPVPPPPLFQPRPVPPAPPKGPGLPDWDDILSAAPAVLEPPPGEMPGIAPDPPLPPLADDALAGWPDKRPPTEDERHLLARVAALLAAGRIADAAAALDAGLADRPEVADALGRPVWLLESLHLALLLGAAEQAEDRARRLRPHLAADDPTIEVLYARVAVAAGNRAAARANWGAALVRRPDLAEALEWLAAHPAAPDGGIAATDLLGAAPFAGKIVPPPVPSLAPAEPVVLADWLPGRLLTGAVLSVAEDGTPVSTPDDAQDGEPSSDLALLFRHPDGIGQPHGFAETMLAAFVLHRQFLGHLRPARLYVGRQPWARAPAEPAVQAAMLAALFPGIRVIGEHDGAIREANLLVVDGAARNAATGTLIGGMMPWVLQWTQDARARAHAACGLPDNAEPPRVPGRRPRVLFLHAPPPCALADPVRDRLFALFVAAGYEVALADTSAMPWQRLVRLAYGADIVAAAHGPVLDLVLWAHPMTRVLEFFPEGTRRYDGQLMAEAAGLAYLGLEGVAERGFIIQARQRWGPPVGHADRLVWALPWNMLEQVLAVTKPVPG